MNVVIISRGAFPGFDGPARRVKYLGAGLASNGCDVSLVVAYPPNPEPCGPEFERAYGYRYRHTIQRVQTDDAGILRKLYHKLVGTWRVYSLVGRLHAERPVDALLICGVGFVELLVAWAIARRFGIAVTVDKNDVNYRLKARSGLSLYGWLSGINIALSEFLLNRVPKVIFTVNTYLYDSYRRTAKGAVKYIIPSFIDRREMEAMKPETDLFGGYKRLRFLSVVTTPPHMYGFVPFAHALSAVKGQYEFRVFLLCSSDQATQACVDRLLEDTGLKPLTTILTNIPPDIVHAVYAGADIILNAQQEPEIAKGGFPGKTAEVLASGRPIITTLFSDLHKFYVDGVNCLVVRYDDIPSYIRAITRLCESPELRHRLGREGKVTAFASFDYVSGTYQLKQDLWETIQPPRATESGRWR